jgi:hypothetical protein
LIVAAAGVGVDKASAVIHSGRAAETIGFAALGILPTEHLLVAASFDKSKVGHTAKDIARSCS